MHPEISQSVIFTYTDDLEQTSSFFRETMELDFVVDQGPCHIFRLSELSYLGVCCLADRPTEKSAVTITLVSNDVDGWYRFLTAKGVEFIKEPSHSPQFNVYSSLFMSPHGYRIEIQSFDDRSWHNRSII
ncbi:MAG: VOC family protein [Gammaproteobacteria bacterium]|nr:VOC family protein [Gammaproteobacteria bacterium]